jgi:FAD/FMN-containing dehydrogenase
LSKDPLCAFCQAVGGEGPVCAVGGKTQWEVGGLPQPGTRQVRPPSGVVSHQPAEMIVRVRAGTTLAELDHAVGEAGQEVALESTAPASATVGGVLAVGRSGVRRLGRGPVRDALLEATAVSARGELVRAGAPLVKNVTGFDLCRLWVGSLGTLVLLGEVVLRCLPRPEVERWWVGECTDPFALLEALYRPRSLLWDGERAWVCLAGWRLDVEDQARHHLGGYEEIEGPPALPAEGRVSVPVRVLRHLPARGRWVAEVGVGVVHCNAQAAEAIGSAQVESRVAELHRDLKARFDSTGRLNPGRSVLR